MKRAREEDAGERRPQGPIAWLPPELLVAIMRLAPYRGLFAVSKQWCQCARAAALPWWDLLLDDRDRYLFGCHLTHNPNVTWECIDMVAVHMKLYEMIQAGDLTREFLDEGAALFGAVTRDSCEYGGLFLTYLEDSQLLSVRNFHPRDMRVTFVDTKEEPHRYKLLHWNGREYELLSNDQQSARPLVSVTAYHDELFEPFDREKAIQMVLQCWRYRNDPTYRYYGLTGEQIGEAWDQGSQAGSANHRNVENYYNAKPHDSKRIEFRHFMSFQAAHIDGKWRPYRAEQILYSEPLRLVGSPDMLYEPLDERERFDAQGRRRLFLADWKFCHRIEREGFKGAMGRVKATDDVPDCNVGHYTVQLHWYMWLLERYYGAVIVRMTLVFLHRDQQDYIAVEVERNDRMIRRILAHRLSGLAKVRAAERAQSACLAVKEAGEGAGAGCAVEGGE